jgi:hypothetical protein
VKSIFSAKLQDESHTKPPKFLFLYTVADQSPTYRLQILNTLCYPSSHKLEFRYRVRQIEPSLCANGSHEVDGVIVFVDVEPKKDLPYASGSHLGGVTYFPLRRVKIRWTIDSSIMLRPAERISFVVTLEDFVRYDDTPSLDHRQWHDSVATFDSRRNFVGNKPRYFVISADDIFGQNLN